MSDLGWNTAGELAFHPLIRTGDTSEQKNTPTPKQETGETAAYTVEIPAVLGVSACVSRNGDPPTPRTLGSSPEYPENTTLAAMQVGYPQGEEQKESPG